MADMPDTPPPKFNPKCPYTYPHKSRQAKVDYITGIGGYSSRHGRYPLEFNVAAYADLDFDNLWKKVLEERGSAFPEGRPRDLFKFCAEQAYRRIKDHLWEWALEDAQSGLFDADTYTHLWDGTKVDVKLGLHGRGGKHLCIESFDGIRLEGRSPEELGEWLMLQSNGSDETSDKPKLVRGGWEWDIAADRIDLLYRYVRQCEIDFTSANAEAEVEYQAAFRLQSEASDLYSALFGTTDDTRTEKLIDDARVVLEAMPSLTTESALAFQRLCAAAGIDFSELAIPE